MLSIKFSKLASKFFKRLPPKQKRQVSLKVLSLKDDPLPADSKSLKGYPGYFATNIGEYRIIYTVLEPEIKIEIIGKRNDDEVYRKFKRLF